MKAIELTRKIVRALHLGRAIVAIVNAYARISPWHTCTRDGIHYRVDLREVVDQGIWLYGWEPHTIALLKRHTSRGDTVVEVGANVGAHTLILADLVGPLGKVYAFEPTQYAQAKLRTNIDLNPHLKGRIVLRSELVTNHGGQTPIRRIKSSFPIGSDGIPDELVQGPAIALDNELFGRLDLLKIDVDGYDYKVLEGAVDLLRRFRPYVVIELCEATLGVQGDSVHDILRLLVPLGYRGVYEDGTPIGSAEDILAKVGTAASVNGFFSARQ